MTEREDSGRGDCIAVEAESSVVSAEAVPYEPGGADQVLSAAAARRIAGGLAASTTRAYKMDWRAYRRWCAEHGRTALPATAQRLAEYVTYLTTTTTRYGAPPAPATIERALGCIQSAHRLAGFLCPVKPAKLVLRDYRRERANAGHKRRQAPVIDLPRLRAMVAATDPATLTGRRDRLVLVLGFAMMGCRSEAAALDIGDLVIVPEGVEVNIRMSKTDQDAVGETVHVPYGSNPDTCPVRLVQAWLADLAEAGVTEGPLLRSVDRHDRLGGAPGFAGRAPGSGRMSGDGLNKVVRNAARRAGLEDFDSYTFHGLRAGGATEAARAGRPGAYIKEHGRWRSDVYIVYVRSAERWRDNPMSGIGL
jgi:integrase